jgi:hypothetical protein
MFKIKLITYCSLFLFLTGCATPVGKMTDSDFVWHENTVNIESNKVYTNMLTSFRSCENIAAEPFLNNDHSQIILYLRNIASVTQFVVGLVKLHEIDQNTTLVRVGIQKKYDSPLFGESGKSGNLFLSFANKTHADCN